jgi:hypothetical protein
MARVRTFPAASGSLAQEAGDVAVPDEAARAEETLAGGGWARHGEDVQFGDIPDVDDVPSDVRHGGNLAGQQAADDLGRSRPRRP